MKKGHCFILLLFLQLCQHFHRNIFVMKQNFDVSLISIKDHTGGNTLMISNNTC